jgi:hypothetical protein
VSAVAAEQRGAVGRVRSGLAALWGGTVGLAPHVLHHVGPLAGAALLVGATGQIPFLIRLQRKFRTWRAPAIALAIFAGAFSLSSFVIGPALSGGSAGSTPSRPGVEQPVGQPRSPPLTNLTTRV